MQHFHWITSVGYLWEKQHKQSAKHICVYEWKLIVKPGILFLSETTNVFLICRITDAEGSNNRQSWGIDNAVGRVFSVWIGKYP